MATFVVHQNGPFVVSSSTTKGRCPGREYIEPNELPCEAAVREVWEETKVLVELVGEKALSVSDPRQLILPRGIQLETIDDDHQHIDLVYFARVLGDPTPTGNSESSAVGWYGREDWPKMGLTYEIQQWVELAVREVKN